MEVLNVSVTMSSFSSSDDPGGDEAVAINRALRLILVEITGALCIVLNSLNISVLSKAPQCFGESTTLLFITLGVVDLCTGVIIMVSEALYVLTNIPDTSHIFCALIYPVLVLFGILSAMLLACLSFDKLIAITRPLRYSQIVTKRRVTILVVIVVLISGMNMVGFWVIILRSSTDIMYFHEQSLYCRMRLESNEGTRVKAITILQTFGFICMFLPLIIVTFVNCRLLVIVYHQKQRLTRRDQRNNGIRSHVRFALINLKALRRHPESRDNHTRQRRRSHYKGLRTVLVMVIAYYLAWMPLLIDISINIILNTATSATLEFVTFFMAYSNSWWNALVYLFMNSTYRTAAYRIIKCNRH